jgi:hypothetical protein
MDIDSPGQLTTFVVGPWSLVVHPAVTPTASDQQPTTKDEPRFLTINNQKGFFGVQCRIRENPGSWRVRFSCRRESLKLPCGRILLACR